MTIEEKIKGRRIGIVGIARSGVAAALLAHDLGGEPFVSDSAPLDSLSRQTSFLSNSGIPFETDGHSERLLECDYLVLSPGVPLTVSILKQAQSKGIPIFSEIEFASWVCRGKIIAVTGSNGKTTTATLLSELLSSAGIKTHLCGNVGLPFSEVAEDVTIDGVAVVEVSTFQLETIADFRPHIAMILNLSPDHLDRHGTFDEYKSLKYRITENQTDEDFLILNRDDKTLSGDNPKTQAQRRFFTTRELGDASVFVREGKLVASTERGAEQIIDVGKIRISGPHNLQNAAAVVCAASILGVSPEVQKKTLVTFAGVEHRMEMVGQVAGINFVNDSKATNVESVCFALRSLETPVYLIAGGRDKGGDFGNWIEYGKDKIKGVVVIGDAREKIFADLGKSFPVQMASSLEEAVRTCFDLAIPGETVLLSPGCSSFDMFESFEHRGRVFKQTVAELRNGKSKSETINSSK